MWVSKYRQWLVNIQTETKLLKINEQKSNMPRSIIDQDGHICWRISRKWILEDVKYLLPVKFRQKPVQ